MATEQIAVRIPEELLYELFAFVARGVYESRAAAVRAGVDSITALERRRQTDQALVAGYRCAPPASAAHGLLGSTRPAEACDELGSSPPPFRAITYSAS
ncbi:MAG: ribbon-helix-helix domain-containing protein [Acidimicrobiales bacterium]